jgi:hypothetical protein
MRVLAPPPMSATEGLITDGYQLCAQCGQVMVEGDGVVLVRRLSSWLIHSHEIGPLCAPKAVRGWKAAKAADTIRALENEEVFREAEPYYIGEAMRPCVCLLDDKHIEAELALVEYQPSDEAITNGADIRSLLARFHFRVAGGGKRKLVQEDVEVGTRGVRSRQTLIRNFKEEDLVAEIDGNGLGRRIKILVETVWSCRRKSYATFRATPPIDPTPHCFVGPEAVREVRIRHRSTRLPRAPYEVLQRDLDGRPVDFALYSERKVLRIRGKWKSEFGGWTPKPKPLYVPYSSATRPGVYGWVETPKARFGPVDSENPYGPIAVLEPEALAELNAQRNTPFRGENIIREVVHARILARRIAREEAVPALAASSGGVRGDE